MAMGEYDVLVVSMIMIGGLLLIGYVGDKINHKK